MLKLKIIVIGLVLLTVGAVLHISPSFSSAAKDDIIDEIAGYKSWSKITKEPIAARIDASALHTSILDGG